MKTYNSVLTAPQTLSNPKITAEVCSFAATRSGNSSHFCLKSKPYYYSWKARISRYSTNPFYNERKNIEVLASVYNILHRRQGNVPVGKHQCVIFVLVKNYFDIFKPEGNGRGGLGLSFESQF